MYTYVLSEAADFCSPNMRGLSASGGSMSALTGDRKQTQDAEESKKRKKNDERPTPEQSELSWYRHRNTPTGIQTDFLIYFLNTQTLEEPSQDTKMWANNKTDAANFLSEKLRHLSLS